VFCYGYSNAHLATVRKETASAQDLWGGWGLEGPGAEARWLGGLGGPRAESALLLRRDKYGGSGLDKAESRMTGLLHVRLAVPREQIRLGPTFWGTRKREPQPAPAQQVRTTMLDVELAAGEAEGAEQAGSDEGEGSRFRNRRRSGRRCGEGRDAGGRLAGNVLGGEGEDSVSGWGQARITRGEEAGAGYVEAGAADCASVASVGDVTRNVLAQVEAKRYASTGDSKEIRDVAQSERRVGWGVHSIGVRK